MSGWSFPRQGAISPGVNVPADQSDPLLHAEEGIESLGPTLDALSLEHEAILGAIEENSNGDTQSILEETERSPLVQNGKSLASQPPSMLFLSNESQDEDVFYPTMSANYDRRDVKYSPFDQEASFTTVNMQDMNQNDSVVVIMEPGGDHDLGGLHKIITPNGFRPNQGQPVHSTPQKVTPVTPRFPAQPPDVLRIISEHPNSPGALGRRQTLAEISPTDLGLKGHPLGLPAVDRRVSMPNQQSIQKYLQRRRPSRTYTVINYGNVGQEASITVPTGKEPMARVELFDIPDQEESVLENVQDLRRHLGRQLSRQLSRQFSDDLSDCQSVISVATGRGRTKRLLSVQQVSHPDLTSSSLKLHKDETDAPQIALDDTSFGASSQRTYDGSRGKHDKNLIAMQTYGQQFAKRKKKRLIQKDGYINVRPANISKQNLKFLRDLFTTLLDLSWRWVWFLFSVTFILSWFAFAIIWFLVAYFPDKFEQPIDGPKKEKCVDGVEDFWTALLFSIETQHTIGYGTRAITRVCPVSFVVLMIQSLVGVVIQCVLAGVVFAKLAKPKNRAETIMFTKKAAICMEDGQYCLVFRVGDMRRSQLVGCILHAFLVRDQKSKDGKTLQLQREHLEVLSESEDYDQYLFLAWPTKLIHFITPDSPLWDVSRNSLVSEQFEIIVVLEGIIESSGMTTQIRTSYLPSEIEWGMHFLTLLTEQTSHRQVEIDYTNFNRTEPQPNMPGHSAKAHDQMTQVNNINNPAAGNRRVSHRSNVSFSRGF